MPPPEYHDAGAWPVEAVGLLDIRVRRRPPAPWRVLGEKGAHVLASAAPPSRSAPQPDPPLSARTTPARPKHPRPHAPTPPRQDRPWAFWERRTHALVWRLLARRLLTLDELRRAVEQLPPAEAGRSYYEK